MPAVIPFIKPAIAVAAAVIGGKKQRGGEKQARREADLTSQAMQRATALTPEEERREQETFGLERRRGTELERRAGLPGEEILGETGPISRAALSQVQAEALQPEKFFASTLEQELELVRMMVNQEANKRGVFGGAPAGGIRFEHLGRAGIELAVKSARERMAARNAGLDRALRVTGAGLEQQQLARGDIEGFLQDQQSLSARGRERAAEGEVAGQRLSSGVGQTLLGSDIGQSQGIQQAAGSILGDFDFEGLIPQPGEEEPESLEREQEVPTAQLSRVSGRSFVNQSRRRTLPSDILVG